MESFRRWLYRHGFVRLISVPSCCIGLTTIRLKGCSVARQVSADAHRGDGKRLVIQADGILTAFVELEAGIHARWEFNMHCESWSRQPPIRRGPITKIRLV